MTPSSVPRPVQTVSSTFVEKRTGTPPKRSTRKDIFGMLKGWTIDSQALSDELKD